MVARARPAPRRHPPARRRAARRSSRCCTSSRAGPRSRSSSSSRPATTGGVAPCDVLDGLRSTRSAGSCSTSTGRSRHRGPDGRARPAARRRRGARADPRLRAPARAVHQRQPRAARRRSPPALREDGLPVADDEVLTPVDSAITYLRRRHPDRPALLFASDAVRERMAAAGDAARPTARTPRSCSSPTSTRSTSPTIERAARAVARGRAAAAPAATRAATRAPTG